MAYFAEIDATNTVVTVLVVSDDDAARGQEFLADDLDLGGTWIQTTKGTRGGVHHGSDGEPDGGLALRCNSAVLGHTYDADADVFYAPQPYPSWSLDENFIWQPPTPKPEPDELLDGTSSYDLARSDEETFLVGRWEWDEDTTSWVEVE